MAGIYEELKRRNVIRVAIAYVAVSWLLIQVVETLFPVYGLSDAAIRIVVAILAVGFIPVVIIAWVFELTPEGFVKEDEVDSSQSVARVSGRKLDFMIIAVLVVALGFFAADKWVIGPTPVVSASQWESSIAVLPFVHISDDPGNSSFSQGLSEEVLNLLAKVSTLKVIGRESIRKFMETNGDIGQIGAELGVKTVLQGSVRSSGDQVRIAAQLTDVSDGSYIWTENYDRKLTDIFTVQEEVATAIIGALEIQIGGELPSRGIPTDSQEAYGLFLRARVLLDAQQGQGAIPLLLEATALDPDFAEAIELLAFGYWQQGGTSIGNEESHRRTKESAARALALDPDLTFAKGLYQLTSSDDYSVSTAVDTIKQAMREQPSNSAPQRTLFYHLTLMGYISEAHRYAVQYVEQDPLSPLANYNLGESLVALGRTDEAIAPLLLALELGNAFADWFIPAFELSVGRIEDAVLFYEARLERIGVSDTSWVRELIAGGADPVTGRAHLDSRVPEVIESLPESHRLDWQFDFDIWYLALGHLDTYFEEIFAAEPNPKVWTDADILVWQGTNFRRVGFTADPRYLEAAEMLGIVDVWEQRGPPDFCEKIEGNWVCQ